MRPTPQTFDRDVMLSFDKTDISVWLWRRLKLQIRWLTCWKYRHTMLLWCLHGIFPQGLRRIAIILTISKKKWKRTNRLSVLRASHCFQHRLMFWMSYLAVLSVKPSWSCNATTDLSTAGVMSTDVSYKRSGGHFLDFLNVCRLLTFCKGRRTRIL